MTRQTPSRGAAAVGVRQLAHASGLPLPAYQSDGAAGLDLTAAVAASQPVTLAPGARALLPTGLVLELPPATEAQVRPRSGLALKQGLTVLNSPGTIDSDYRGEVQVILINLGQEPVVIRRGDRIAQMVIAPVVRARLEPRSTLAETQRGAGGFGSTGTRAAAGRKAIPSAGLKTGQARAEPAAGKSVKKSKIVASRASPGNSVAGQVLDKGRSSRR